MTSYSFMMPRQQYPVTNVLENCDPAWTWKEFKEYLWLNFSNTNIKAHAALDMLEDAKGAYENIQQFMARYKQLLIQDTSQHPDHYRDKIQNLGLAKQLYDHCTSKKMPGTLETVFWFNSNWHG